jgi:hypothetical protein
LLQCSQQSSHLGNECPIMIVKGEADAEYRSRVLPLGIYFLSDNTLVLYTI